jgi:hypothetical protein
LCGCLLSCGAIAGELVVNQDGLDFLRGQRLKANDLAA